MATGKGKQPATSIVASSSSEGGGSSSTLQAFRGSGSGGNGNDEHEQMVVHRISSSSQALRGSGSGSGGNGNGEYEQVVVHKELPLDSLILSLAPPFVADDLNDVVPPPPPARAARAPRAVRNLVPREPTVPPPYPWATNLRATVHSIDYLLDNRIYTISGNVVCKKCRSSYTLEFDLLSKFLEVKEYIICFRDQMNDRAPTRWTSPEYPTCRSCQYPGSLRPLFGKKRTINWLFLFLTQLMGSCSIAQLKYFCKHTNNHRTGAKDRLIFLAYLGVGKQLQDIEAFTYKPF